MISAAWSQVDGTLILEINGSLVLVKILLRLLLQRSNEIEDRTTHHMQRK